jgi:hypothetical protein
MERWSQACRHELLDRTLIWNQAHLLHALRPLPTTITDPEKITHLRIYRHRPTGDATPETTREATEPEAVRATHHLVDRRLRHKNTLPVATGPDLQLPVAKGRHVT